MSSTINSSPCSIRHLAVLLTCFNRRELTVACLHRLFRQELPQDLQLTAFLVDDGSTDGTAEAVRRELPQVRLLQGDGSLFWNGGMRTAFAAAVAEDFDALVWLNDDTMLVDDAIARLVQCACEWKATRGPALVAGAMQDPATGRQTYGGFNLRRRGVKLQLEPVAVSAEAPIECDTMNGNLVLIPREIAMVVGNLDPTFRHQIGDLDYGLRARAAGFPVVLAAGYLGFCSGNSSLGTWRDRSLPFRARWKSLMSPKGAPFREWFLYTRRHYGWRWPLYAFSPYIKTILTAYPRKSSPQS